VLKSGRDEDRQPTQNIFYLGVCTGCRKMGEAGDGIAPDFQSAEALEDFGLSKLRKNSGSGVAPDFSPRKRSKI
jgi:hypothetical protein